MSKYSYIVIDSNKQKEYRFPDAQFTGLVKPVLFTDTNPKMSTHEDYREYDVIFAGGGTAACVAAGRLAQADPNLSILIIERGKNNLNDPMIANPGIFVANLAPSSTNMVWYQAESEPALSNRARVVPTGGILGGGSSTNAMMYVRAQAVDFDSFQMEGWDSKSLIACAKKEGSSKSCNAKLTGNS